MENVIKQGYLKKGESMIDWCDALERTLNSLGILKCGEGSDLTPPPLPASVPPPLRRSGSPTTMQPPDEFAPPPPPPPHGKTTHAEHTPPPVHGKTQPTNQAPPLPPLPSHAKTVPALPADLVLPPLPVSSHSQSGAPPPLPPGRQSAQPPPPLPPGRPHTLENKLRPPRQSAATGVRRSPHSQPGFDDQDEGRDSEDESSDYSSDFVSGAFWEINRKIPVPTARRAILSSSNSPASAASSSSGGTRLASVSELTSDGATLLTVSAARLEELDEGYSDLKTVQNIKKSLTASCLDKKSDDHVVASMKKSASEDAIGNMVLTTGQCSGAGASPGEGCSPRASHNCAGGAGTEGTGADTLQTDGPEDGSENFYAPFPAQDAYSTPMKGPGASSPRPAPGETTLLPAQKSEVSGRPPSPEVESTTFTNDVLDDVYSPLSEASTFPDASAGLPPLPPRLDSLPAGKDGGSSSSQDARPVPLPRKNNPPSPALPPPPISQIHSSIINDNSQLSSTENPPSLPPRKCSVNRVQSFESSLVDPPPLPARKAQSLRQRPVTGPPVPASADINSSDYQDEPWEPGAIRRQHSGSGADAGAAENHLRQRMRLDRVHSMHAVVSLKQSQAEILKQEMELPGVTITVTPRAATGIGLVDCGGAVCLHNKFHVGDQVISVCNNKVTSAAAAHKMLKHPTSDLVEMLVKRTPHAQVLTIRRAAEGENIGIKRNGGTAEILYVDPHGLAAQNGLPLHAAGVLSDVRTNWMLTEINSRHLSLFFKDVEIEHRLNAVGREITIVVQPSDYILELKKQLKKLKNYKNFVVS
ncbi:hypothetical protein BaRGS_00014076 [Batillaria attramentaria]|uniref:PDZ domain-containing protein n=1 Tax=Batillaria attramentaria TaxID=370345 RepID=A0ABD0L550_9CAEN